MQAAKIINDPVYGFISIPKGIIHEIIDHPLFQRLRRIKQGGFSYLVYPGAMHTRFHHALGAFHLGMEATESLRSKGVQISDEEAEALWIALLLHDLGHGPFSHTLEFNLMEPSHEQMTLALMHHLNDEFRGALDLAIEIFQNKYDKPFLNQLVSGQLDLDRMDYLARDSFFTGVAEGVIGYRRIIKMLNVVDGQLVVEEKGIYSIEKFLMARKFMYWQVYYHKAVIAAERMLQAFIGRVRVVLKNNTLLPMTEHLAYFLASWKKQIEGDSMINHYANLDDSDIIMLLKNSVNGPDKLLSILASGLLNRNLFKVRIQDDPIPDQMISEIKDQLLKSTQLGVNEVNSLVVVGTIKNIAYSEKKREISILQKYDGVVPLSEIAREEFRSGQSVKHYIGHLRWA